MSVTVARGFLAAGVACGIKESGALDLALVAAEQPVPTAAVFTRNRVQAAPVKWSRAVLADGGLAQAVIVNSGNANAATGPGGDDAARRMAACVGDGPVLVCSTGLIGIPLPVERIEAAAEQLRGRLADTPEAGLEVAQAIMTTDTHPKQAVAEVSGAVVGGMAKGAAMLHPDMATMLAVLTTDAAYEPDELQAALGSAVDRTFNRLCTDGCTSTNDTVIVMASGESGVSPPVAEMTNALTAVCGSLAEQMARDAEGATRFVRVRVTGARNESEAVAAARSVVKSDLVRCSFHGADPYWGRILSELGTSGVPLDPDRLMVAYGEVVVCRNGGPTPYDLDAARAAFEADEVIVTADLGMGGAEAEMLTCDLGPGYIEENMRTS